jgi:hypothetical protein
MTSETCLAANGTNEAPRDPPRKVAGAQKRYRSTIATARIDWTAANCPASSRPQLIARFPVGQQQGGRAGNTEQGVNFCKSSF